MILYIHIYGNGYNVTAQWQNTAAAAETATLQHTATHCNTMQNRYNGKALQQQPI